MLKITDLTASKDLDHRAMAGVRGGTGDLVRQPVLPFPLIDFSTGITSKVADVRQGFNFAFAQANTGAVTNNQEILGGNGSSWSPVDQYQYQDNWMDVSGVGTVSVS